MPPPVASGYVALMDYTPYPCPQRPEWGLTAHDFLLNLPGRPPGWAAELDGPAGLVMLAGAYQADFVREAALMSGVRAAALTELLTTTPVMEAAQRMGVSRAAVRKAAAHEQYRLPLW